MSWTASPISSTFGMGTHVRYSGAVAIQHFRPEHSRDRSIRLAKLRELVGAVEPVTIAADRTLPVADSLLPLLPHGLRRGSVCLIGPSAERTPWAAGYRCAAPGTTTLALTTAAAASQAGRWCAAVGFGDLSALGAAKAGVLLDRFALIPQPGNHWSTITASLLEAMEVVLLSVPERIGATEVRRLRARARERGSVLVPVANRHLWTHAADLHIWVTRSTWSGLDNGWGYLRERTLEVTGEGRGVTGRSHRVPLSVPA